MSLKGMTVITIAKEKFNILRIEQIKEKIPQEKFREFVNNNKDIFLWKEETISGKKLFENLEKSSNKEADLRDLNQYKAYAFYKKEKGYYALGVIWNPKYGTISVNFNNSRVTIAALEILLKMAEYCDAMLLVRGRKQITREFIEKEKAEIEEKKKTKPKK